MASPKVINKHVAFQIWSQRGLSFMRFLLIIWSRRGLSKNQKIKPLRTPNVKSATAHHGFCPFAPAKNSGGRPDQKQLLQTPGRRI